jgi:hypothetical protein
VHTLRPDQRRIGHGGNDIGDLVTGDLGAGLRLARFALMMRAQPPGAAQA